MIAVDRYSVRPTAAVQAAVDVLRRVRHATPLLALAEVRHSTQEEVPMDFNTVRPTFGSGPTVIASGELDMASAPELDAALAAALEDESQTLTIDVAGITFCDSMGLRALLSAPGHRPVRLLAPSATLLRLLDLTGTRERFQVLTRASA